jgi:hypothetical protein
MVSAKLQELKQALAESS